MTQKVVITGASGSVGREVSYAMAMKGYNVVMAVRNLKKAEAVKAELVGRGAPEDRLELRLLDLSSFASIREFAATFKGEQIIKLFNNAGVINRDYGLTAEGYERTLQVNFLAPALLTKLLLEYMTPDAEIVNVVSLTSKLTRFGRDLFTLTKFSQLGTYARTKMALLVYSVALSEHISQRVNVSDPGIVNSNMISMGRWFDPIADVLFRPFISSPAKGARSAINALNNDSDSLHYFVGMRHSLIAARFRNHALKDWLYSETEKILENAR